MPQLSLTLRRDLEGIGGIKGTQAVVATHEVRTCGYFSIGTQQFVSPQHSACYDMAYTLVQNPGLGWRVDNVDAASLGEVF